MPVILQPADYAVWLGAQTKAEDLKALLKPLPEDLMERYRVSRRMSNARNEGEECNGAILWRLTFPQSMRKSNSPNGWAVRTVVYVSATTVPLPTTDTEVLVGPVSLFSI